MNSLKLALILIVGGLVLIALGFGLSAIFGGVEGFPIACVIAGSLAEFIAVQLVMFSFARFK